MGPVVAFSPGKAQNNWLLALRKPAAMLAKITAQNRSCSRRASSTSSAWPTPSPHSGTVKGA